MSYNTDLQNNNTSLQEILATVNALPEAGGSSGGGGSNTSRVYTLQLEIDYSSWEVYNWEFFYCNGKGEVIHEVINSSGYLTYNNVQEGLIFLMDTDYMGKTMGVNLNGNITEIFNEGTWALYHIYGDSTLTTT